MLHDFLSPSLISVQSCCALDHDYRVPILCTFGMQASLNELKERHPRWIEIVGAQVMNTHTSFHRRMLLAGEAGRAAYDYALRTTSGYEPGVDGKCCDGKVEQATSAPPPPHTHP